MCRLPTSVGNGLRTVPLRHGTARIAERHRGRSLRTMPRQGPRNLVQHRLIDDPRSPQITPRFMCFPRGQMTRPRLAMLRLALRRQAEPLLRSLVRFLLWHLLAQFTSNGASPPAESFAV